MAFWQKKPQTFTNAPKHWPAVDLKPTGVPGVDLLSIAAGLADVAKAPGNGMAFLREHIAHLAGFNYRMTSLQAAVGLAQTERFDDLIAARRRLRTWYDERLRSVPGLLLPREDPRCSSVFWMYGIRTNSGFGRSAHELRQGLARRGVETRSFFVPMHLQPVYADDFRGLRFPVSEALCGSGLYLPTHGGLEERDVDWICDQIRALGRGRSGVRAPARRSTSE